MLDSVIAVTLLAVVAGIFLMLRESGSAAWSGARGDSIAKYVIATFLGTYGSVVGATLLVLPILLYGRLAHSQTAEEVVSAAVDRPYFLLQSVVAFAVGFAVAVRLRQGKPTWVWVWPVAHVVISIALDKQRSVLESFTGNVWQTYFNWDCGCSATLLQWHVMSAVYPATAFTLGALFRYGLTKRQDATLSQIESIRR